MSIITSALRQDIISQVYTVRIISVHYHTTIHCMLQPLSDYYSQLAIYLAIASLILWLIATYSQLPLGSLYPRYSFLSSSYILLSKLCTFPVHYPTSYRDLLKNRAIARSVKAGSHYFHYHIKDLNVQQSSECVSSHTEGQTDCKCLTHHIIVRPPPYYLSLARDSLYCPLVSSRGKGCAV